jgi:cobalamin biosynthesis Mg chelatase CobN
MSQTRPRHPHSSARLLFSLLSVLAVLAFACSPALAHAEEATGPVYETEVPTVPTEESPGGKHPGGANGGNGGGEGEAKNSTAPGGGGTGGGNGSQGGGSQGAQGNQGSTGNGGQSQGGSVGSGVALGEGNGATELGENSSAIGEDDSSSPLVPILIAIVVLAAISIGAFYYRQRRQDAGSSVSPKAS